MTPAAPGGAEVEGIRTSAWDAYTELPQHVADYPSMLSRNERQMLRWLAAEYHTGTGAICDLGSFLGGSTISLAEGARAAGRTGKVIHSYDRYRLRPRKWAQGKHTATRPYPADGDFLPATRELMGGLADLVEFHKGDFPDMDPPPGAIEILFVDIAKTPATSDHIVAEFLTRLVPGRSVIVQQDYFHIWPPFDVYVMEILRDHFEPLSFVSTSALFLNTKRISAADAERALSKHMSVASLQAALQSAAGRWPPEQSARVEAIARSLDGAPEVPETKQDLLRATRPEWWVQRQTQREKRQALRVKRRARRAAGG